MSTPNDIGSDVILRLLDIIADVPLDGRGGISSALTEMLIRAWQDGYQRAKADHAANEANARAASPARATNPCGCGSFHCHKCAQGI